MLLLHVTYRFPTLEDRAGFFAELCGRGIPEKVRRESGNILYDYFYPANSDKTLLLVEKWADAPSLEAHGQQAHVLEIKDVKKKYVLETTIERYAVD